MIKSKKGWIRIVEAFIAVLLIAGVLLFVINRGYIGKRDISEQVYQVQLAVLREIELNSELRVSILAISNESLPVEWENFTVENNLDKVRDKLSERLPDYLTCEAKICKLESVCPKGGEFIERDIYAQGVAITAETTAEEAKYDPRQLKLFCWTG